MIFWEFFLFSWNFCDFLGISGIYEFHPISQNWNRLGRGHRGSSAPTSQIFTRSIKQNLTSLEPERNSKFQSETLQKCPDLGNIQDYPGISRIIQGYPGISRIVQEYAGIFRII